MNENRQRRSWLRGILVLVCLGTIAGALVAFNHLHGRGTAPTVEFALEFNAISHGDTAETVKQSLGTPGEVTKSRPESEEMSTALPVQVWHYQIGSSTYFIRFEPPGLDHWDNPMKWRVELKGKQK